MQFFPVSQFMRLAGVTSHSYAAFSDLRDGSKWSAEKVMSQADRRAFEAIYAEMEAWCAKLELVASIATIKKMRRLLGVPGSTYGDFFKFGPEFADRLMDEMEGREVFGLSFKEARYLKAPRGGWGEVTSRFPDSVTDIEEAQACLAFERYAASVFHSLQIVEVGLIELGKLVGVTDPRSGWSATTQALKKIIETKHQDRIPFHQANFSFFEQAHGTVEALKNAWRNKISHAQGRLTLLKGDFTPAIADEILIATRAFMHRLATDGPSSGERPS